MNKKKGRPTKPYRTSWGEHIEGLRKKGEGRWFITAAKKEFREQDERRAVHRFRQWESEHLQHTVVIPNILRKPVATMFNMHLHEMQLYKDPTTQADIPEAEIWAYFREQLITRPEWVAARVGIEEVARLADLPKPQPSPTLTQVGRFLQDRSESSDQQKKQLKAWWSDFRKFCAKREVTTLKGIDTELAFAYANEIKGRDLSPRYISHWLSGVKTNISFGKKNGLNPTACQQALDALAVMRPPKKSNKKRAPHPIKPVHWHTIYEALPTDRDKAVWLCMLNFAMYPKEATELNWEEMDFDKRTLVTDRNKTDVIRVAVLWKRTVEALQKLGSQEAGPVFTTTRGTRLKRATYAKLYREVRRKSGVPDTVKLEDCRDGAQQAASDAGIDLDTLKRLAGHQTGIQDSYIIRTPQAVEQACMAIEDFYFN